MCYKSTMLLLMWRKPLEDHSPGNRDACSDGQPGSWGQATLALLHPQIQSPCMAPAGLGGNAPWWQSAPNGRLRHCTVTFRNPLCAWNCHIGSVVFHQYTVQYIYGTAGQVCSNRFQSLQKLATSKNYCIRFTIKKFTKLSSKLWKSYWETNKPL